MRVLQGDLAACADVEKVVATSVARILDTAEDSFDRLHALLIVSHLDACGEENEKRSVLREVNL